MAETKPIEEAKAEDLARFAEVYLGLEIKKGAKKDDILQQMKVAGYARDSIVIPPEVSTRPDFPQGDLGDIPPSSVRFHETETDDQGNPRMYVRIRVPSSEAIGGKDPVPTSVNGRRYDIPRDQPCWVPIENVRVLQTAVSQVYEEYDAERNFMGGLGAPRSVLNYPFSFA